VASLLKSEVGPFPEPEFPQGIDLPAEERKARRRLYPVTVVYSLYFAVLLIVAFRSDHALVALGFVALGVLAWTPTEHLVHRYLLHGVFPKGQNPISRILHYLFDSSHSDHHARPWDGMHINGHVNTLALAAAFWPLSFIAPPFTAPYFVATLFVCFVIEEWTHHAIHFWNFKSPYFQYIRRRHLFHHSRHGVGLAYGITSGIWDTVARTRVPPGQREALSPWARPEPAQTPASPSGFGA